MFRGTTSTYLTQHLGCPLLALPRTPHAADVPEPTELPHATARPARGDVPAAR